MPRIDWSVIIGWNLIWLALWILATGALVAWYTTLSLRNAWHRTHAEAMAETVRATSEEEALARSLASVEDLIEWMRRQVHGLREKPGVEAVSDLCERPEA